ncbi:unnamed protein product [Rotaria sp. Silwood1]|nr:unnamed protein product [Rotaria sp. Silwood1]
MPQEDRSSFILQGFEPSAVRLKRKLRLILNKSLRRDKISDKNVTLSEFIFYSGNVVQWRESTNNSKEQISHQILLSNENFVLGVPRLRQIRVNNSHCQIIKDLSVRPINCYAFYHKSKEYRDKFTSVTGSQYEYTSSKITAALQLSNAYGPYDTGGFIYYFRPTKDLNDKAIVTLKNSAWLDLTTRAIFIELIYFNPNIELLTSINILFEFLTTGTVQVRDFFYTVPVNSFFFGRNKLLGVFQILFNLFCIIFAFYYVGKIAEHRLWFIMSSIWNLYDLGLLILFTVSFYFDIKFLMYISQTLKCLSIPKNDIFKELIYFIETQISRIDLQAYIAAAVLIRLLRYLPHFSNLIANLLDVFYKSIRNSLGFLFLFFVIFMSFVIFATFHYGDELYEVISFGVCLILICIAFLVFIRYLLRHKDYIWTANIAQFIKKRLEMLRFLLQVLFMNPYVHRRSKKNDTIDYKKMKFIFTEYGKVSTVESEKASAGMIAELATNVEETFGLVATRLCRALHSKDLNRHRFRYICCMPAFIFVSIQISLLLTLSILLLLYGIPSNYRSINITYISLTGVLGGSVLLSCGTCLRLLMGLMKSPKSKIIKLSDHSSRLNESSLYRLKKEVSQLSYIIKSVEAFLNINTRLVVLIDGLDVCEQQRILQILDQVHVLLTKENDPFITLIVCDPHKMMQDLSTTISHNQGFDTSVNGHDYLRSIIQLPIYLQLNMSKTKQLKKNSDVFPKKRANTLTNGASVLDVSAKPVTTNKLPKNKRRRQRRDTLPNTKPVTT